MCKSPFVPVKSLRVHKNVCWLYIKEIVESAYSTLYEWHTNVVVVDSYRTNNLTICNGLSKLKKGRNNVNISGKKKSLVV